MPIRRRSSRYEWLTSCAAFTAATGWEPLAPRAAAAADEPTVKVGVALTDSSGPAYYAQELGLFTRAGITVELQSMSNGGAIVAAVVSGALQIGSTNTLALAVAFARGIPLVMIAPGAEWDAAHPNAGLLVTTASPLTRGADLNGKVVAVPGLGGIDQLSVSAYIAQDGGDLSSVKFVEIPPGAQPDAAIQGRVDAIEIADPTFSAALASKRLRLVASPYNAIAKRFMLTVWFVTPQWLAANKSVARTVAGVLATASTWAMKNPEQAAVLLGKYVRAKEDRITTRFADKLDPALVQPMYDAGRRFGVLSTTVASKGLMWNGK